MKTLLIIVSLFFSCQNQKSTEILWNALLIPNQKEIPIYTSYKDSVIKYYIKNDTLKEEFILIKILEKKKDFFKVKTASAFNEEKTSEGWIAIKNVGVYLRPRNEEEIIPIYDNPIKTSAYKNINGRKPEFFNLINIIDIKERWFKIKYIENKNIKEGWLNYENQCSNPYSTCN